MDTDPRSALARGGLLAAAILVLFVVAWFAFREPGPARTGVLPDGGRWEEYDEPETGKLQLRIEYDPSGAKTREAQDGNGNGHFEVVRHFQGGSVARVEISTRDDGRYELTRMIAGNGMTRELRDANGDGNAECVTTLINGVRIKEERDTNGDGRPDVWVEFEDGRLKRMTADTDGDGAPDHARDF